MRRRRVAGLSDGHGTAEKRRGRTHPSQFERQAGRRWGRHAPAGGEWCLCIDAIPGPGRRTCLRREPYSLSGEGETRPRSHGAGTLTSALQRAHARHARRLPHMPAQMTDGCLPLQASVRRRRREIVRARRRRSALAIGSVALGSSDGVGPRDAVVDKAVTRRSAGHTAKPIVPPFGCGSVTAGVCCEFPGVPATALARWEKRSCLRAHRIGLGIGRRSGVAAGWLWRSCLGLVWLLAAAPRRRGASVFPVPLALGQAGGWGSQDQVGLGAFVRGPRTLVTALAGCS